LRVLFAGRLDARKGIDLLVEGLTILKQSRSNWHCVVAGNGDVDGLRGDVRALGLEPNVEVPGWLSSADVHKLMIESDVVLLPSRGENLPMSLIEGACAGAALIATDQGATREILNDGINGLIISLYATDVAESLVRLCDDRMILADMQRASREIYLQRFRIDRFIDSLHRIYQRTVMRV
jgi:glycosyltransferase involved in cell wall biosynthesis